MKVLKLKTRVNDLKQTTDEIYLHYVLYLIHQLIYDFGNYLISTKGTGSMRRLKTGWI